jgi:hypothetical protein
LTKYGKEKRGEEKMEKLLSMRVVGVEWKREKWLSVEMEGDGNK